MSDNCGFHASPFKGPFKGKGANNKALRQLNEEMSGLLVEMTAVVKRFDQIFNPPRFINLRILKREYPLLWWREAKQSGSYVRLFQSQKGLALLDGLMPQARAHLVEFDRQRLHLNFRATVVGNTLRAYLRYEEGISQLEQLHITTTGPWL